MAQHSFLNFNAIKIMHSSFVAVTASMRKRKNKEKWADLTSFYIPWNDFFNLQYSSQVTSPTGTCKYHNGAPCEAPMLTCLTQDLRVTAWITTSHASIFTCQQGPRKDQPATRPAEHSSLHPIVASHLRMIYLGL